MHETLWEHYPSRRLVFLGRDSESLKKLRNNPHPTTKAAQPLFITDIALCIFEFLSDLDFIYLARTCHHFRSLFNSCHFLSSHNPLSYDYSPYKQPFIHSIAAEICPSDPSLQANRPEIQAQCEYVEINMVRGSGIRLGQTRAAVPFKLPWPKYNRLRQVYICPCLDTSNPLCCLFLLITQAPVLPDVIVLDLWFTLNNYGLFGNGLRAPLLVIRSAMVAPHVPFQFTPFAKTIMFIDIEHKLWQVTHDQCEVRPEMDVSYCGKTCELCLFYSTKPKFETSVYLRRFGNGEKNLFRVGRFEQD